jgi:hypothetical protein
MKGISLLFCAYLSSVIQFFLDFMGKSALISWSLKTGSHTSTTPYFFVSRREEIPLKYILVQIKRRQFEVKK